MPEPIHVLVVDDEPDAGQLAAEHLERAADHLTVTTVTSAEAGIETIGAGGVDCVVSDYDMPGSDGISFLRTVRAEHGDLPFILFTAKGSEEVASDAISAGATDYLQKESGVEQYEILANRVTNVVEQRQAEAEARATQRQLQALAENTNDVLWMFSRDWGELRFINGAYEAIWGRPVAELKAEPRSFLEGIHPEDRPRVQEAMATLTAGEPVDIEYRVNVEEDYGRWVWVQGQPVTDEAGHVTDVAGFARDVTDRKTRERELRQGRSRFSRLFDNFPEPAIEYEFVDGEPVIRAVNEAFVETFGHDADEAIGASINELVVPTELSDQAESLDEEVQAGERLDVEVRRQTTAGYRDFRIRNIATPDDSDSDGFAIYTDITERKQRERDLERQRDRTRAITQAIPDVIILYDAEGRYREVLTGQDHLIVDEPQALQGKTIDETVDAEAAEALYAAIDRTLETGTVQTLEYSLELDGGRTWFEGRLAPFRAAESDQVVLLARDVTDRKTRERKLDRLRERSRKLMYSETRTEAAEVAVDAAAEIIATPSNGVHLLSDDGQILEASVMSDTVADLLGEVPSYHRDAEPGSRAAIIWDAFERGEPLYIDDAEAYEPLTEPPLSRSVLMHPIGRHGMFIASAPRPDAYDETDRTLFEILATSLTTAMDRVEREASLGDRERELQRQNERLEEFASVISHDLRNPLNVLVGSLELAEETGEAEAFDRSRRAVDRMEQLIDDMLTLARAGQTVAEMEPVDLASVVDACWTTVGTGDAELENRATLTVRADESRLQQLLENLVRNAVEHGGPDVTVTVGDLDDGFYVEDDGPGILADLRDQVFESGFSTADEGTGFGLAIVEEIATAHGWEIQVEVGVAGGARFEITEVSRVD